MKKLFALLFISVAFLACSSDDDSSDQGGTGGQEAFTFNFEGQEIVITTWEGFRREKDFGVRGSDATGRTIVLEFNRLGNLNYASTYTTEDLSMPILTSHYYFNSNYFDFNLTGLDEGDMKISGTFSGNVYEDDFDLNSPSSLIEGSFNVAYTEVASPLEGYGLSVLLDGEEWLNTASGNSHGGSGSNIELGHHNDGAFEFSVVMNHDNTIVGSYPFTSTSDGHRIIARQYDPTTQDFIEWNAVGILEITERGDLDILTSFVRGSFSGTLTDPNSNTEITLTNGLFGAAYGNY